MNKVYILNVKPLLDESLFQGLFSKVNPAFYNKINKKTKIEEKCRTLGGAYLLNIALEREGLNPGKTEIKFTDKGKPFADNVFFNISHSGKYAVCVIGDSEIGVDIQNIKPVSDGLLDKIALPTEKAKISAAKQVIKLWTRKEALAKCIGSGIGEDIWNIDIMGDVVHFKGNTYGIATTLIEDYYLSVCAQGVMPTTEIVKIKL